MSQVCISLGSQSTTKAPIAALLKLRERIKFLLLWVHQILAVFENRPGNAQLVHLVNQGGALQAKFGGGAFGPPITQPTLARVRRIRVRS